MDSEVLPPRFKLHEASIEVRRSGGAYGDTFDTAVVVVGYLQSERKLVRSASGEEVVSSSSLWLDPGVEVTEGSKVTVLGQTSFALGVSDNRGPGGLHDHLEVSLA